MFLHIVFKKKIIVLKKYYYFEKTKEKNKAVYANESN